MICAVLTKICRQVGPAGLSGGQNETWLMQQKETCFLIMQYYSLTTARHEFRPVFETKRGVLPNLLEGANQERSRKKVLAPLLAPKQPPSAPKQHRQVAVR